MTFIPFPSNPWPFPAPFAYRLSARGDGLVPLSRDGEPHAVPGIRWHDGRPLEIYGGAGSRNHDDWPGAHRVIARHWSRIVPWGVLWAAPGFSGSAYYQGHAWPREGVAVLLTSKDGNATLEAAMHEAWHLLEEWLPADVLAPLDAELKRGPRYGLQWSPELGVVRREEYLSLLHERRARFFARFAMMCLDTGGDPSPPDWCRRTPGPWDVVSRAWSGELGGLAQARWEAAHALAA